MNFDTYTTTVYAKCSATERKDIWESLEDITSIISGPWCMRGDFNIIMELGAS